MVSLIFLVHLIQVAGAVPRPFIPSVFTWQGASRYLRPNEAWKQPPPKPLGAVASESSICTEIGTDLISRGGSAADAVVGTVLCVGVVGMYHSGIGGGGFMLVRAPNRTMYDVDFRESAPAKISEDVYRKNPLSSLIGGLSVGVPGELRGLQWLHEQFGVLPWKDVVMPSVHVAREGWTVGEDLVKYMSYATRFGGDFLTNDPNWALDFAPTGKLVKLGDQISRKRYADSLELIAEHGPDIFYSGAMAQSMVDTVNRTGGVMDLEDLEEYKIVLREPVSISYRNFQVTSCSAPASGAVALGIMKMVEGYEDFGWESLTGLNTHRLNEAFRFGYAQRASLGDPPFVPGVEAYQANLINSTFQSATRSKISDEKTHGPEYYNPEGREIQNSSGTAQISVVDSSGLAISITSTINLLFGSQVLDPHTGIILNDELNDFSIPGQRNAFNYTGFTNNNVAPKKRPLSSITPAIVEHKSNGSVYFVTGAAGGSRIPTATIQSLWNVLDRNMSVYEALSSARLHDQLAPNMTDIQEGFDKKTAKYLEDRGHIIHWVDRGMSAVHAIKAFAGGEAGYEAVGEPHQKNSLGKVAYEVSQAG